MSNTGSTLFVLLFGILVIGNLACQIYVSAKVFSGAQVIRGILRGTRTFIHGWKRANELGIKDIMIFWSILLTFLLSLICVAGTIFIMNGPPRPVQEPSPVLQEAPVHLTPVPGRTTKIYVAAKPVKQGEPFPKDAIELQDWAGREIPSGTIAHPEETFGKVNNPLAPPPAQAAGLFRQVAQVAAAPGLLVGRDQEKDRF